MNFVSRPAVRTAIDSHTKTIQRSSTSSNTIACKAHRGGNYMPREDAAIVRASIYVSTDAIVDSGQKVRLCYRQIFEAYKEQKPTNAILRTQSSVETRLKSIIKECGWFASFYKTIDIMKKSSASVEEEARLTKAFYNEVKVELPCNNVGLTFRFMNAGKILRDLPKFSAATTSSKSHALGHCKNATDLSSMSIFPRRCSMEVISPCIFWVSTNVTSYTLAPAGASCTCYRIFLLMLNYFGLPQAIRCVCMEEKFCFFKHLPPDWW